MQLKKLDRSVLKLWYTRAAIVSFVLVGAIVGAIVIPAATGASQGLILAISLGVGIPFSVLLCFTLIMPVLRHKMYAWGYDDKRIVVKCGVIFRQKTVIPICQIQDLHRIQGPLMIIFGLSGVTISTAGSNFDLSTLTNDEADCMIDELECNLKARLEEQKNAEI